MKDKNSELERRVKAYGGSFRSKLFIAAIIFLLVGVGLWYWLNGKGYGQQKLQYKTEEVKKGDIVVKVSATGTLQPLNQVELGVEISGTIEKIEVDYNSIIKKGQVLAKLDTSKLEAQVLQSKALLEMAKAKEKEALGDLELARTKLRQLEQARELSGGRVPSQTELDVARANILKAESVLAYAKADIAKAEADLRYNQTNLSKAVIKSPLDGIVLARKVEPGQTVAASLQTPVLFTIAEDLTKMELKVDVDEADIGKLKVGQEAEFVVDAYPDMRFKAKVKEIRLSPKTTQGVVTYETVLDVENPDLYLKPGMTATADIVVKEVVDCMLVPNTAFRFRPPVAQKNAQEKRGILGAIFPFRPPAQAPKEDEGKKQRQKGRVIYKLEGDKLVACKVLMGETDGRFTEVKSKELKVGDRVVLEVLKSKDGR